MYINSTNLSLNMPEYSTSTSSNWVSAEKYYNCDNFFYYMNMFVKKRRHLWKKR